MTQRAGKSQRFLAEECIFYKKIIACNFVGGAIMHARMPSPGAVIATRFILKIDDAARSIINEPVSSTRSRLGVSSIIDVNTLYSIIH